MLNRCVDRLVRASGPLIDRRKRERWAVRAQQAAAAPAPAPPQSMRRESFVLAVNDQASACSIPSGAWLQTAPRGAYTTARTVNGDSVFELSFHIDRLASSAHLMLEADVRTRKPGADMAWAAHAAPLCDPHWLRPRVMASIRAAVEQFRQQAQADVDSPEACASSSPADSQGEMKLTVLVTWDSSTVNIHTHVAQLPPRPQPPVVVEVRGAPRSNAAAKDSEWVRQRRVLEESKGAGVQEVLLSDPEGRIYEGLSSNFFAVMDGAIHTADEGILAGSVRHLILAVAKNEGIPVVLEPPRLADVDKWSGCFISSTSRLLLPVDDLVLPDHAARWAAEPEALRTGRQVQFSFPRGGLVSQLEALVQHEVEANSEPLFA